MSQRTRMVLLWALLPVGLLLAGVVNYFTGGLAESPEATTVSARLDFGSAELEREYRSATVLRLPWGDGGSQVALSQDPAGVPISTLEAIVPDAESGFLLVDHPPKHVGARVRRFNGDGALQDTVLTPIGSTLFASVDGRLAYVVAKQADGSERLVVSDGSRESTYVVPLSLNSGSIVSWRGGIWVTATKTGFDAAQQRVTATDLVIPVVLDGKQVTDEEATKAAQEGWLAVNDQLYTRDQLVDGYGETARVTQTLGRAGASSALEIPGRSTPLGIDEDGLIYVQVVPEVLGATQRRLAGTLWSTSPTNEVLVGRFDGTVVGKVVVPGAVPTVGGWSRFAVAANGDLLAAVSGRQGVSLVRYVAVSR